MSTYSFYGKDYDFNNLERDYYRKALMYIDSLGWKDKDALAAYEAGANLLSGIGSGRITWNNGRFIDSKGEYTNSLDKRDPYGIMASFIYSLMDRLPEYLKPVDKSKILWDGGLSLGTSAARTWFNSDNMLPQDLKAWWDLDPLTDNKRGVTNRIGQLRDWLNNVKTNFDTIFEGYSDRDKSLYLRRIDNALNKISDNSIDPGDIFVLNLLGTKIPWDDMFKTDFSTKTDENTNSEQTTSDEPSTASNTLEWKDWATLAHPEYTGQLVGKKLTASIPKFGPYYLKRADVLLRVPEALTDIIYNTLFNKNYEFRNSKLAKTTFGTSMDITNAGATLLALDALKNLGKLKDLSNGLYLIPGINTGRETSLVWNSNNNSIAEISNWKLPFKVKEYLLEYLKYSGKYDPYTEYDPVKHKNGGVLKAQTGLKFFTNLMDAILYTPDDLASDRRLRNIYNEDGTFTLNYRRDNAATDFNAPGNNRYDLETGGLLLEEQNYYKDWLNILTSRLDVAEAWARRYRELLPTSKIHYLNWFDNNDNFNFLNFLSTIKENGQDSGVSVYNDKKNGIGHDLYRGRAFQILGRENEGYLLDIPDGYELVDEDPELSENGLAFLYKLRPIVQKPLQETPLDNVRRSDIVPKTETQELPKFDTGILGMAIPWALSTGRLFDSLHTNNKIAETLRKGTRPYLADTYELHSPVTGDYSAMTAMNRQAADTRRLGARPITSDASLMAAQALDANRLANQLEEQGRLMDDQEIRRTKEAALARMEDNIKRRNEVANLNRKSLVDHRFRLADIEANRLKSNWASRDNYLKDWEQRLYNNWILDRETRRNFYLQAYTNLLRNQYDEALYPLRQQFLAWQQANQDAPYTANPYYSRLLLSLNDLNKWLASNQFKILGNLYGINYSDKYTKATPALFVKDGGKMINRVRNILNKK